MNCKCCGQALPESQERSEKLRIKVLDYIAEKLPGTTPITFFWSLDAKEGFGASVYLEKYCGSYFETYTVKCLIDKDDDIKIVELEGRAP